MYKDKVLKEIIDKFFENYENFLEKGFMSIRDKYLHHFYLLNEIVKINTSSLVSVLLHGFLHNTNQEVSSYCQQSNEHTAR